MRKSNNLKIALLTAVLSVIGLTSIVAFLTQNDEAPEELAVGGGPGTINQISPLIVTGGYVKVASSTAGFQVPSLANCDTIDTDGDGKFECGTDGGGAGGSATTTINGVSGPDFTFASGTATGIGLIISTSTGTLTFTPTVSSGYVIPLSASTTEWHNKVSSQWGTSGSNIYYSAGNVGIGTTTPTERLAVTGEGSGVVLMGETGFGSGYSGLSFNGGLGVTTYNLLGGVTQNHLWINRKTGGDIYFRENNVDQVVIKGTTGNVGIGTASPSASAKLHIDGSNALIYTEPSADDGQWNGLNTLNSSGAVIGGFTANTQSGEVAVGSRNASYFTTIYGGSAERMRITSAGNVGIGTSTPVSRLAIQTTGTTDILNLFETGGTEVLTVLESGNVGIGTTNPTTKLFIKSATGVNSILGIDTTDSGNSTSNATIRLYEAGTNKWDIYNDGDAGDLFKIEPTGGTNSLTINSTGNVGIGTTAPDYKLDVRGSGNDSISASIQVRSLAALGNTSAAALVNVKSINSSGFYGAFPSDYATATFQDRVAFSTNSDASGLTLAALSAGQDIRFFAGGSTESVRINSSGNVGIGTTTPAQTLSVAGSQRLTGAFFDTTNASGTVGQILSSTGTSTQWITSGGSGTVTSVDMSVPTGLSISGNPVTTSGTLALSLTSGYVIPLTASTTEWAAAHASTTALTPSYIRGLFSNTATGLTYNSSTGATSLTANYVIPLTASTTEWHNFHTTPSGRITDGTGLTWSGNTLNVDDVYVLNTGDSISGNLTFSGTGANIALGSNWLSGDGDDEGIYVDSTGNVGIGTTTIGARLSLQTTGTTDILNLFETGGTEVFSVLESGNIGIGTSTPAAKLDLTGTAGSGNIFTISSSTNSRLLTLNALGYLGIGSSTPSAPLVVDDGVNATSTVQIGGPGSVGCLAIRDTDDAGYTYVTALNGVLSASMTSCE